MDDFMADGLGWTKQILSLTEGCEYLSCWNDEAEEATESSQIGVVMERNMPFFNMDFFGAEATAGKLLASFPGAGRETPQRIRQKL